MAFHPWAVRLSLTSKRKCLNQQRISRKSPLRAPSARISWVDMQPKNSMVRHLVSQGFTVFMVSWKNPDASMEDISFEDYMDLGPLEATDVVREITGAKSINVMGYCIGGTLLALTLAWLARKGDKRFSAATFMVSLQDFTRVGDTAVFMDEPAMDLVEQQMME